MTGGRGPAAPAVKAEQVRKSFGSLAVLRGIDLQVRAGEVMCLIGPSGSGKTTLLRCIGQLEKIDAGRLHVNGQLAGYRQKNGRLHELRDCEAAARRRDVGMVFQHFNLFPHLTALGNIMEAPVRVRKEPRDQARRRAQQLLEQVGLDSKARCYPAQLSGGQQQRVAIARALAMEPRIMLFDEPTSALDPELTSEVLDVIRRLAEDGTTMIVATHEIGFACEIADTLAFLDHGAILEHGHPRQLLDRPQHERTRGFLSKVIAPGQPRQPRERPGSLPI
jgi:polar amino acid transport system ATP-binding protein